MVASWPRRRNVGTSVPPILPEQTRKATKEAKALLSRLNEGESLGDAVVDAFGLKLRAQAVISLRHHHTDTTYRPFRCLMADCNKEFHAVAAWLVHECDHARQKDLAGILRLKPKRSLFFQALLSAPLSVRQEFGAQQNKEFQTAWLDCEAAFTTTKIRTVARSHVFQKWE